VIVHSKPIRRILYMLFGRYAQVWCSHVRYVATQHGHLYS